LVPIFLAHLAGVTVGESGGAARARVVAHAAAYVLGFSLVFVSLGLALGAAGSLVETATLVADNRIWLIRVGGALLVLLGLHQLGLISLPVLNRQRRIRIEALPPGSLASTFMIGVTFGAGWSPCVGPILGAILTMAAGRGESGAAAALLTAYAFGLGLPFIATALAFGSAPGILRRINRRLHAVTSVSGGVMVAMGAILLLGIYQRVFTELIAAAPWMPWEPNV
jgi:cytochrome c-type biogenesis protein